MTDSPRPRRADAARNRARVLEAAFEVFSERGRGGVGPEEIKALVGACYTVRAHGEDLVAPVVAVVLDGLRPSGAEQTLRAPETKENEHS